jgi:hypothetical protein
MPELTWHVLAPNALILTATLAAGFVNAIAGGSTFFSYPAFVACGVAPALASASNNVGLWPGNAMAAFAYRSSRLFLEYFVDRRPVKKSIAVISLQRAELPLWSNFIKLLQSLGRLLIGQSWFLHRQQEFASHLALWSKAY